jgi:hypothetical protein
MCCVQNKALNAPNCLLYCILVLLTYNRYRRRTRERGNERATSVNHWEILVCVAASPEGLIPLQLVTLVLEFPRVVTYTRTLLYVLSLAEACRTGTYCVREESYSVDIVTDLHVVRQPEYGKKLCLESHLRLGMCYVCMCVCVCVCVCMYVCMCVCVCVYACTYACMYAYVRAYM